MSSAVSAAAGVSNAPLPPIGPAAPIPAGGGPSPTALPSTGASSTTLPGSGVAPVTGAPTPPPVPAAVSGDQKSSLGSLTSSSSTTAGTGPQIGPNGVTDSLKSTGLASAGIGINFSQSS